jgi:hypothetical protein
MVKGDRLFEPIGYSVGIITFLVSTVLFYNFSADLYYSLLGAFLSALMVWLSYVIMRVLFLASR